MPSKGHPPSRSPETERLIPTLSDLPRPLYARAESLSAGSWTPTHRHDWVQFSYAISGVLGVHTDQGSFFRAAAVGRVDSGGPRSRSGYLDPR